MQQEMWGCCCFVRYDRTSRTQQAVASPRHGSKLCSAHRGCESTGPKMHCPEQSVAKSALASSRDFTLSGRAGNWYSCFALISFGGLIFP